MSKPERVRVDWSGGQGPPALLMHANGFVPRAYTPLLQALSPHLQIEAMATRGQLGFPVPKRGFDWSDIGYDLGQWLTRTKSEPVVGIGHSMGATSLIYAAHRYPQAFRALVIIEPASTFAHLALLVRLLPFFVLKKIHPMRGAVQKRDRWPNQAEFLKSCTRSGLYRHFDQTAMQAIAEHLIEPCEGGVQLVYPKAWEAYNFSRVCDPIPTLRRLNVPVIGIRAADSFFMNERYWQRFRSAPSMRWQTSLLEYGHLLPLEGPQDCARAVIRGLEAIKLLTPGKETLPA